MVNGKLVLDLFVFSEELDVLEIRLNELNSVVDYFCLVEANKTQTRLDKPYYFEDNKERFKEFLPKIVHIKLDEFKEGTGWEQEHFQRESLKLCIKQLQKNGVKLSDDDYFLLSDVDECPKASVITELVNQNVDLMVLNHYFGSYWLNTNSNFRSWGWYGTIIGQLYCLNNVDLQYLRDIKDSLMKTGKSGEGWHFSSLLVNGFETLYNKWVTRIEPADKSLILGPENKERLRDIFEELVLKDRYFMFSDDPSNKSIKLETLPLSEMPEYVKLNPQKYKNLLIDL